MGPVTTAVEYMGRAFNNIDASDIELGSSAQSYNLEAGMTVDHVSNLLLKKTLDTVDGNKTLAAKMMGVSLRWVHYRLKKFEK